MGYQSGVVASQALAATVIVTTTELVIATLTVPTNGGAGNPIRLEGYAAFTTGATTTAATLRIRQGNGITGTVVNVAFSEQFGASLADSISCAGIDSPAGEIANQVYSLTLQLTGASTNGSVQGCKFEARWGN